MSSAAPGRRRPRAGGGAVLAAGAAAALAGGLCCLPLPPGVGGGTARAAADPASEDPVERGAYVWHAAGCAGCHTDSKGGGAPLAGGVALETPYGTFHAPNISPDPEHGIGGWSDADFLRALREGRAPDGSPYYPAFPYTSYTGMTDRDALDLKAYIFAQESVPQPSRPHDLRFPYSIRLAMHPWRWLFLDEGPFEPDPGRPGSWNRGAYLVEALAHCGECHTPRNFLGAKAEGRKLAGNQEGPEGQTMPNITPDPATGIGDWSPGDLAFLLELGMTPDGDFVGGRMGQVVQETTGRLTPEDRRAIAEYVMSLPPVEHAVRRTREPAAGEGEGDEGDG